MTNSEEIKRLEKIAEHFSMLKGVNGKLEKYRIKTVLENATGRTILDVGCADGVMAKSLSGKFSVTGIDGSVRLIKRAKKIAPKAKFICTLFEDFETPVKFDNVVLSFILEHVEKPQELLGLSKTWVKKDGRIIILVPNANSLHRMIGKAIGIIDNLAELGTTDITQGHRRIYDLVSLKKEIEKVNLKIVKTGGYFIKPLSEAQMISWSDDLLNAFYEVSRSMPAKYCAEIYAICRK